MKMNHGRIAKVKLMIHWKKNLKLTLKTLSSSQHIKSGRKTRIDCGLSLPSVHFTRTRWIFWKTEKRKFFHLWVFPFSRETVRKNSKKLLSIGKEVWYHVLTSCVPRTQNFVKKKKIKKTFSLIKKWRLRSISKIFLERFWFWSKVCCLEATPIRNGSIFTFFKIPRRSKKAYKCMQQVI